MAGYKRIPNTVILGVPFSQLTDELALDCFEQMVQEGTRNAVVTANLDFVVRAMKDPVLKRIIYNSTLITADGMPMVWAGRTMKPPLRERVAGSDFVPLLLERASRKGLSVFFLGGKEGHAREAAERLTAKYPALEVAGTYSPPFAGVWEMDNENILTRINQAKPDILLVAFGNPKQEYWISRNWHKLNVKVAIGAGATIDFLAGKVPRAPEWMKKLSAEWIFRIYREPRRLAKRYAIDLRDGLPPLVLQTATNALLSLLEIFVRRSKQPASKPLRVAVPSTAEKVQALVLENCSRDDVQRIAQNPAEFVGDEIDAVVLDLRSTQGLNMEVLSHAVSFDRWLRTQAKHCIFVTGKKADFLFRMARINDLLTITPGIELAIAHVRAMGKRTLSIVKSIVNGELLVLALNGELTINTVSLLGGLRTALADHEEAIIDFSGIECLDAGGVQYLIDFWNESRRATEIIHCVSTKEFVTGLLNMPGLRDRFVIHESREEAISSINKRDDTYRQVISQSVENI